MFPRIDLSSFDTRSHDFVGPLYPDRFETLESRFQHFRFARSRGRGNVLRESALGLAEEKGEGYGVLEGLTATSCLVGSSCMSGVADEAY